MCIALEDGRNRRFAFSQNYLESLAELSYQVWVLVVWKYFKERSILNPFHLGNCLSGQQAPLKYPASLVTLLF